MSNNIWKLGVVSYLNACPLTAGLHERDDIVLYPGVPAALPGMLSGGVVDVALIPVIDFLRDREHLDLISDACIAGDGETLTVRVFSHVPPERIEVLRVDGESHTSVALAQVLWAGHFHRRPAFVPLEPHEVDGDQEAVLLIGDKVVQRRDRSYAHCIDLGGLWKEWTGLPFVFAAWAAKKGTPPGDLPAILNAARDAGVNAASEIAEQYAARHGWPIDLAREYLTHRMKYRMDAPFHQGMTLFFELVLKLGAAPVAESQTKAMVP